MTNNTIMTTLIISLEPTYKQGVQEDVVVFHK